MMGFGISLYDHNTKELPYIQTTDMSIFSLENWRSQ